MLTASEIRRVKDPGIYRVDNTLYLRVADTGARNWIQRIVIHGKRRNIGLGSLTLVDVLEAKERAIANRRLVMNGGDPLAEKRKAKMPIFIDAMQATIKANSGRWAERTGKRFTGGLNSYAVPKLGGLRLDQIGRAEVLRVLAPIWNKKPSMARKVREHLRTVFSWAQAHEFIEHNPAGEMIDGALPAMPAVKSHHAAMPYEDVPDALQGIRDCKANLPSRLCMEFIILTGCRSGEARAASWDEIDYQAATWTISADRMKARRDHVVPLSDATVVVLRQAAEWAGNSDLIFPSPAKRGVMTDATLLNTLTAAGLRDKTTVHGCRSSFRDWCSHTRVDRELAELCLAHKIGNQAELAYKRTDLLEARRPIMSGWAQYATGVDKPVPSLAVVND